MDTRRIVLNWFTRRKLKQEVRWAVDARYRTRCQIVLRADERWGGSRISAALNCSRSHVDRTLQRFEAEGLGGLVDRREDNGNPKADENYIAAVREILRGQPTTLSRLRTGGPANKYCVDAILHKTLGLFQSTGKNWMKATFSQDSRG